jgi:hypothetical protein
MQHNVLSAVKRSHALVLMITENKIEKIKRYIYALRYLILQE